MQFRKKLFTLVEMLIVLVIVGILFTIVTVIGFNGMLGERRDNVRLSDVENIKKAIENYTALYGTIPSPESQIVDDTTTVPYVPVDSSSFGTESFYAGLESGQVTIGKVPKEGKIVFDSQADFNSLTATGLNTSTVPGSVTLNGGTNQWVNFTEEFDNPNIVGTTANADWLTASGGFVSVHKKSPTTPPSLVHYWDFDNNLLDKIGTSHLMFLNYAKFTDQGKFGSGIRLGEMTKEYPNVPLQGLVAHYYFDTTTDKNNGDGSDRAYARNALPTQETYRPGYAWQGGFTNLYSQPVPGQQIILKPENECVFGKCIYLNGGGYYFNTQGQSPYNQSFALNFWIKGNLSDTFPAGTTNFRSVYLFASDDGPASPYIIELLHNNTIVFHRRDSSNNVHSVSASNILDGNWHQVTVSYGANKLSPFLPGTGGINYPNGYGWRQAIYIDGVLVQQIIPSSGALETKQTLGAWNINYNNGGGAYECRDGFQGDCAFKGYLDEMSVWTTPAGRYETINPMSLYTKTTQKKLVTRNGYGKDPNLLLYYQFNDQNPNGTIGEAYNASRSGINTARYLGGATTDYNTPAGGLAYKSTGTTAPRLEIGTIPGSKFDPSKGFSACWWERIEDINQPNYRVFNFSNGGNTDAILVYKHGTGNTGYKLYVHNSITGLSDNVWLFGTDISNSYGLQDKVWNHWCFSVDDNGNVQTWKDGAYVSSNYLKVLPAKIDRTQNHIGYTSLPGHGQFVGHMDEFMFFEGPIDQSVVDRAVVLKDAVMTSITNNQELNLGLTHWWDFDYKGFNLATGTNNGEFSDIVNNWSGTLMNSAKNWGLRGLNINGVPINPAADFVWEDGKAAAYFGYNDPTKPNTGSSPNPPFDVVTDKNNGFSICAFVFHYPGTLNTWGNYFEMYPNYKSTCLGGLPCGHNFWYVTGWMNRANLNSNGLVTHLGPLAPGDTILPLNYPDSPIGSTLENTYAHYCYTIKTDGSGGYYRNGVKIKSYSPGSIDMLPNISYWYGLAGRRSNTDTNIKFYMDDLMLFNKGLSDQEVTDIYYYLSEGDYSNQNNLIKNNFSNGITTCAWIKQHLWGSKNNYLQITTSLHKHNFNTQFLFYSDFTTGNALNHNLKFNLTNHLASGTYLTGTPTSNYAIDGDYHHHCAVQDNNGNMKLYLDGNLVATGTNAAKILEDYYLTGFRLIIGNQYNTADIGNKFDMDDLRMFNKALSPTEIQSEYIGSNKYYKNAVINSLNIAGEHAGKVNGVRLNSSNINCTGCTAQISFNGVNVNVGSAITLPSSSNVEYKINYYNPNETPVIHQSFNYDLRYEKWYDESGTLSGTATKPSNASWTSMSFDATESEKAFVTVRAQVDGKWTDITDGDLSKITSDTINFVVELFTSDRTQSPQLHKIEFNYATSEYASNGRIYTKPLLLPSNWVEANSATLNVTENIPTGTTIEYYLSLDGGSHYKQLIPGNKVTMDYTGLTPIIQILMTTNNPSVTPKAGTISVEFEGKRKTTTKVDLDNGIGIPKEIMDKIPVDPKSKTYYKYAVSGDGKYYQIGVVLENRGKYTAYVSGNYPQTNSTGDNCPDSGTPGVDLGPIGIMDGCTDKNKIETQLYKLW